MKKTTLLTTVLALLAVAVLTACGTPEVAEEYQTKTYVPEELQAALASDDPSARADAAAQVRAMPGGQQQAVLLELTKDSRPTVRLLAVGLIGKVLPGDQEADARLAEMLSLDPDADVRVAVVAALGEAGSGPAMTALLEALGSDTSLSVRRGAALALDRLTGQEFGAEMAAMVDAAQDAADDAMMNYEDWFDANQDALSQ